MKQRSFLDAIEAGERFGVSRFVIYRWVREKHLPAVHLGGRIFIPRDALDTFMASEALKNVG